MAVTEQTPIGGAVGNGVTTVFPFSYYIGDEADLVVQRDGVNATLNVDYVVSGAGNPSGGQIAFVTAPANGVKVTHFRDTTLTRSTDYQDGGDLPARTVNQDFDRLWLALQEIFSGGKGSPTSVRAPSGEVLPALPPASSRANTQLLFDSLGRPYVAAPVSGSAADVLLQLANTADNTKNAALVGIVPNDQNGGASTNVRALLLSAIGSSNPTLKSAYADSPTATVTGEEYLWSLGSRILANRLGTYTEISALFSGDSTTFGVNAPSFPINVCFERETDMRGMSFFKSYNRGHSGEDAVDWAKAGGYVEDDIAAFPNMALYVARWGLNDGLFQSSLGTDGALNQYKTNLRLGLSKLRAFKDAGSLSIVLMTPNTTSEDPYRNERWHEKIQAIVREAARDYQCVFIDTYQLWRDGRGQAIGKWLDNVSGAGIHPDDWMTMMIGQRVADVVCRPFVNLAYSKVYNVPGGKQLKAPTDQPATYDIGITYYRTDADVAWPASGVVRTERTADNVVIQTLIALGGTARVWTRRAVNITTWGAWYGRQVLSVANGWIIKSGFPGPVAYKSEDNRVTVIAALDGTSKSSNQAITLPAGWRPLTNAVGDCRTQAGTHGAVIADNSGGVTIVQGGMSNFTDVHIDFTFEAFN